MSGGNSARIFFDSENGARNGSLRLGVKPQNKASGGEQKILHVWAVRPPATNNGRTKAYVHPEVSRFLPERPNASVAAPPARFDGKNYSGVNAKRARRSAAVGVIESWGATNANMRSVKLLGEGVSGSVYEVPATLARAAVIKTSYIVTRPGIPRTGAVAVKFQTIRDMKDLGDAILETQTHAIASSPPAKGTPWPSDIPPLAKFVPRLYAAWYDASTRLFVTIMDMVVGEHLGDIIEKRRLTVPEFAQLRDAFAALWARGIFHADAHGDNVIIDSAVSPPRVTIIDFGQSVFLPPMLRPTSMSQATSPEYAVAVEAYVARRKAGKAWFNPNTRTLKIAKARSNAASSANSSLNSRPSSNSNARSNAPWTVKNANRTPNRGASKNGNAASNGSALANRIANRAANAYPNLGAPKNSNGNKASNASSDVFLPSAPRNAVKVKNSNINSMLKNSASRPTNGARNGANVMRNGNGVSFARDGTAVARSGSRVVIATNATAAKKRKRSANSAPTSKRARVSPTNDVKREYSKIVNSVIASSSKKK